MVDMGLETKISPLLLNVIIGMSLDPPVTSVL